MGVYEKEQSRVGATLRFRRSGRCLKAIRTFGAVWLVVCLPVLFLQCSPSSPVQSTKPDASSKGVPKTRKPAIPPPRRGVVPSATCATLSKALPSQKQDQAGRVLSEPKDKIAFIYDQTQLRTFELQLSKENLAKLDADPTAEVYVKGKLIYDGKTYEPVGIRYKGSIGSWVGCTERGAGGNPFGIGGAKICPKLNFKVSFNKYNSSGRFFGAKKLLFHAMNADFSLMRERLGYWLFRQMGVPAPRAVHVRLLVNGVYAGVFLNLEYIDGRFTRSRFADGKGNLFKEIWPTASYMQPKLTEHRWRSGLRTNEDESPSMQKMLDFGKAVMQSSGDASAKAIQDWMSVENTLRFIAVDRATRSDDGPFHFYCNGSRCQNHNFYIYEEEKANRVWLIPWDLDRSFVIKGGGMADGFVRVVDRWNDHTVTCRPRPGGLSAGPWQMPPSCDPLFKSLGCHFGTRYRNILKGLLDGPYSKSTVEKMLGIWQKQIAKIVQEAHDKNKRQLSPTHWQAGIVDLKKRIEIIRKEVSQQLKP